MKLCGICFDMDGIITNTENIGAEMLIQAAEKQGFTVTMEQWKSMIGASWEKTMCILRTICGESFDADRFLTDWKELTLDWMRENGVPLMPYPRETLEILHEAGWKMALCTSNDRDVVNVYLQLSGLDRFFPVVITSNDVRCSKPAPDVYLQGCAALGLKPAECAGVEDSYNGITSVRRAGMTCVMIPDQLPYTHDKRYQVDAVLQSLQELPEYLNAHA